MKKIILALLLLSAPVWGAPGHVLTLHNEDEPRSLDPAIGISDVERGITENIFEGLTDYDPKDNHPIPAGAESWSSSPDGRTYTFNLRKNATWSDGTKVEAKDYLYQECFWGSFSRSIILPQEIDPDRAVATLKNGVLTIRLPKVDRQKAKKIKVKVE